MASTATVQAQQEEELVNEHAIERLRASKTQAEERLYNEGELAGVEYALQHAEYLELERLVANCQDVFRGGLNRFTIQSLAHVMTGERELAEDTVDFLQEKFGYDIHQPKWMEGFVAGAVSKFCEFRAQI